jgi:hypothetical protein
MLCVSLCVLPVAAVSNQNLYWGFSIGQRFDYTLHLEVINGTEYLNLKDVDYYIVVKSLPAINDSVHSLGNLPSHPDFGCYYTNDTEVTPYSYIWLALPIGNWSLIIDLFLASPSSLTEDEIINTPTLAGFNFTMTSDNLTATSCEIYSKSTGALYTRQSIFQNVYHDIVFRHETRIDLIESSGSILPYLAIAGGAVLVIAIGVIIAKRARR